MKHTSPTAKKCCTPFKWSKARIKLFPEKLQQLDTRKAMLQKAVVHSNAKATKCSVIIETKLFFFFPITFFISFSSFSFLFPASLHGFFLSLMVYSFSTPLLALFFTQVSPVHVFHLFSLYMKFCIVSSVMDSVFCPTDTLPL